MSLESHLGATQALTLGGAPVVIRPITLRQVFRLIALVDKVKGDLGMTRADFEKLNLSGDGLGQFLQRVVTACIGPVDLDKPETPLSGAGLLACRELGALLGVSADAVADAPLSDLYQVAVAFWEANAAGPLGEKLRRTIDGLKQILKGMKEEFTLNYQLELMKGRHVGGTAPGGTIMSSFPSTDASDGPSPMSSTESPLEGSSPSSPLSATSPDSNPPQAELLPEAEGALEQASLVAS